MISVKNGKRIGQPGDIFEVNLDIAQMSWWNNIFKDMKPDSKFYIQLHDIRKSSRIYYIFKYLKLKQDFNITDDGGYYENNHNTKLLRFTREQLIELVNLGSFVNKLDTVDLATLFLYSEIK